MKSWTQFKSELPIIESVIPVNKQYGFLGTARDQAHQLLSPAVANIKKANSGDDTFKMSDKTISHFLDSKGGRHLADLMMDKAPPDVIQRSLKKSLGEFKKVYNANMYESYADNELNEIEDHAHLDSVRANASTISARIATQKRLEAQKKARAELLAKRSGIPLATDAPKPTAATAKAPTHTPTTGIYHANPAKRAEAHRALRKVMEKPLPASSASEKIKHHFDDGKLHTDIHHFAKTSPDVDVRPLVKKRMEQLRKQRGF